VSRSLAYAAGARAQGEDVARTSQALGLGGGVGEDIADERAVAGADAGGHGGVGTVNGDGVSGSAGVLVVGNHLREAEGDGKRGREGGADETGGVANEEAHLLRGHILGGDNEIGLVFA
jgi:hypothetical protein